MISFNYETDFVLPDEEKISTWISQTILSESKKEGEILYVFCTDDFLHKLNVDFLSHDTFTDIISFDYSVGNELHGEIYISIDRVLDNSERYHTTFSNELSRVIIHGVLHYCGYRDKSIEEQSAMTAKEDFYLAKLL